MTFSTKKFLFLSLISATCAAHQLPTRAAENVVKNSGFEVGTEGYGIIRAEYLKQGQKEVPYYDLKIDTRDKYAGDASLRIDNPHGGSMRFFTKPFKVNPTKKYYLSFAAKAGIAGQSLNVNFETAENRYGETGGTIILSKQWKRYTLGPLTIPDGRSLCKIQLMWGIYNRLEKGTSLWLDAFQVREAPDAGYAPRSQEIGIVNVLPRTYVTNHQQNYPIRFKVRNNAKVAAANRIRYQVLDEYFNKVISRGEVKNFAVAPSKTIELALANISPKKRGKFVFTADLLSRNGAVLDQSRLGFAVIDSVKKGTGQFTNDFSISNIINQQGNRPMGPLGETTDLWTFYGRSVAETFDFRAEAGDRWLRSWDFNWSNIEPERGKFNWTLTDIFVREATKRGMRVFPTLGDDFIMDNNRDAPQWLRDDVGTKFTPRTLDPKQQVILPTVENWKKYVRAIATRYKGTITAYEVFNEPNLWITPERNLVYLKAAYQTIKEVDPNIKVVAFSSSQDYGGAAVQYLEDSFKAGGLNYCDIVSFHPYGARLDWSTPLSAEGMIAQIRTLMNKYGGQKKGLWGTELFHLGKPGGPGEDDNYLGRGDVTGAEHARRYLIDLSSGLGRSFTIPEFNYDKLFAPKSWAVNNHLSVGGEPSTTFVIYNTITRIFERAKPRGEVKVGGKNKLYLYSRGNQPLAATWSFDWDNKPSLLTIPNASGKLRMLDVMGNPMQPKLKGKDVLVTLTNTPIYFLPAKGAEAGFRALLQRAKASSNALPSLGAGLSFDNNKNVLVVEVHNAQSQAIIANLKVSVPGSEFSVPTAIKPITVPAESSGAIRLPIQSKGGWLTADVNIQATVGLQTFEKKIEVKPVTSLPCPPLQNAVQLDGQINTSEWQDARSFNINRPEQLKDGKIESWGGIKDLSGTGYVKYDSQNLYLALKVQDQKRGAVPEGTPFYDREAIELFLDAMPEKNVGLSYYQRGTAQLMYAIPQQESAPLGWQRSPSTDKNFDVKQIKSAIKLRDDGYDVEFAIPWKQLGGFKAVKGATVGFDVALDDADDAPHREKQLIWVGGSTNYADRTLFGRLLLQ